MVGVQSNSIQISFNVGGIIPHSGFASNERSNDGSGKFFTFFNLEKKNNTSNLLIVLKETRLIEKLTYSKYYIFLG